MSDDSSAASSGDEMLNMPFPLFSQDAHATNSNSPGKSSAKGSDSEDDAGSGKNQKPQDTVKLSGKKRQREELLVESTMDATGREEKAQANASNAFKIAFHDCKIGAPDKLFWHEHTKKKTKEICPVRVVPTEETVGLALSDWNGETHCPIQYIEYPHQNIRGGNGMDYSIASRRGLFPYYGKEGEDRHQWCPVKFEQYSKQLKRKGLGAVDLKNEEFYLQCVLQKSLAEGEQEKKLAEVDEAVPEEKSTTNEDKKHDESDSKEENGEETRVSRRQTRRSTDLQDSWDSLRAGDMIEFYKPTGVAGEPNNLCTATILYIDPKLDSPLTIDEYFTTLQPEFQVRRIKRKDRGKLLDHPQGTFRPINKYDLKKGGDPNAHKKQMVSKNEDVRGIIKRAKENVCAKLEEDGLGFAKDMLR